MDLIDETSKYNRFECDICWFTDYSAAFEYIHTKTVISSFRVQIIDLN